MSENFSGEIEGTSKDPNSDDLTPLNSDIVNDSDILAKFEKILRDVGIPPSYLESLPKNVKRRVSALKKIQLDIFKVESKFYAEVHKLESKYAEEYKPLFDKRSDIVNAVVEPTDAEVKEGQALAGESDNSDCLSSKVDENTKGIPLFWFTTLKTMPLFEDLIMSHDEEVMKQLTDVSVTYKDEKSDDETTNDLFFKIHFQFAENKYFEDKVLTKRYYLDTKPSSSNPLSYRGPTISKSSGCPINWKEGMNLTSAKDVEKMTETELDEKTHKSFFDLFNMKTDSRKDLTEEEKVVLQHKQVADFKLGQLLQSSVIPKAVLFFTGEMVEDGDDDDCEDEGGKGDCKQQ